MTSSKIKNISAIGAGAMGSYTALSFAMAGYDVKLYDLAKTSLDKGIANISAALDFYAENGIIEAADKPAILQRVHPTDDIKEAAQDADWIIESVLEELAVKRNVFAELDTLCPPHTIFATNTSGLSPTAIAEAIARKDKFVVTHFWNPPHLLPLVEVVPGKETSEHTMAVAHDLMLKIGKKPVSLKRECPGFVGNRLQLALLREALAIVDSGIASAEDVDAVVEYSLGRRLAITGPIKSADIGGLDVFKNIFSYLGPDLDNTTGIPAIISKAVDAGNLGAKTGKGMYPWQPEELVAITKRRVTELLRHMVKDLTEDGVIANNTVTKKRVAS